MKRFAWLTDVHLNFLPVERCEQFFDELAALRLDGLLLSGDIAESHDLADYLTRLDDRLAIDIYFVLGNHDFYYGSIRGVREAMRTLCAERPRLHYLSLEDPTLGGPIELAPEVALVGHDGWADARLGDYRRSHIFLHDYQLISELSIYGKAERRVVLERLGDEAATHVSAVLPAALETHSQAVLLTHVPPLREACWYEGRISDDQWAPHFTCKAVGDAILEIMAARPDRQLTVLCGHTHGAGQTRPLDNVLILTGGAEYGQPAVQRVFEF
jgi:3',5'-cyclic AMP phosphodiesterase CpdA